MRVPENDQLKNDRAMPSSILFVCNMNAIRSPMAEILARAMLHTEIRVDSAGLYEGGQDFFVQEILAEVGLALGDFSPKRLDMLDLDEFDCVIVLTAQAQAAVKDLGASNRAEFWDTPNPTEAFGARAQLIQSYRICRDALKMRIRNRFSYTSAEQ